MTSKTSKAKNHSFIEDDDKKEYQIRIPLVAITTNKANPPPVSGVIHLPMNEYYERPNALTISSWSFIISLSLSMTLSSLHELDALTPVLR